MAKITLLVLFVGLLLVGCANPSPTATEPKQPPPAPELGEMIHIKKPKYGTQLVFDKSDFQTNGLTATQTQEIKSWWDSLPLPLQSEIKANNLSVEVVANINHSEKQPLSPALTDAKIEQTGAALEQLIGAPTDMTYTVNTTTVQGQQNQPLATTDILIMETVPVSLKSFSLELPLSASSEISNETAHALQYWWVSLPEEVQQQVKTQQLYIELTVCTVKASENQAHLLSDSQQKLDLLQDLLHRLIGVQKTSKRSLPLAKIQTQTHSEAAGANNIHFAGQQQLKLQLKGNKASAFPTL